MTLSAVLSALGLAPKNLDEARAALTPAKATLDSVATLFINAGLNLEQMLAGGPDALKSHLEALAGDDEALAAALLENENLDNQLATARTQIDEITAQRTALLSGLKALGLAEPTAEQPLDEAAVKAALDQHATKHAAVLLARTGHPGVKHIVDAPSAPVMTRKQWEALDAAAKQTFFRSGGKLTD